MNAKKFSVMFAAVAAISAAAADKAAVSPATAPVIPAVVPADAAAVKAEQPKTDLWAFLPEVVARVNGKDVTRQEFAAFIEPQLKGSDGKISPMVTQDLLKKVAPMQIKGYVDQKLLLDAAAQAGFVPSAEMVKKTIAGQLASLTPEQRQMVENQLKMSGKSMDAYIAEMAESPVAQQTAALEAFFESMPAAKKLITEAEAKDYYEKNIARFTQPADGADAMRASHILFAFAKRGEVTPEEDKAVLDKANAALAKIKDNPASFADVAKAESACPSKMQGGSLGVFGKGDMVPEFEKAVMELKEGEITQAPVKTAFGYHIIRRDAAMKESVRPFAEVKDSLMAGLEAEKMQKLVFDEIARLEKANKVEFMVPMQDAAK